MVMLELEVVLRQDAFIVVVEDDEADAGSGWDFCLCNGKKSSQFVLIELDGAMCLSYFTIHLP